MGRDTVPYPTLGTTGIEVSRLCLGCLNFGSSAKWMVGDRAKRHEIIDRALDLGINFLDTANVYSPGESEETDDEIERIAALKFSQWLPDGKTNDAPRPVRGEPSISTPCDRVK
jgi:hypothetical protein